MVTDFDKAFLSKIKKVWPNTQYAHLAIAYYNVYDSVNDPTSKLELPLLNIYRPTGYEVKPGQNLAARLQGLHLTTETNPPIDYMVRFVSAELNYQIDIYAATPESMEEVVNDIIHMMSLSPTLTVKQEDKTKKLVYEIDYDITYSNGPVDGSEFDDGQRLYRSSIVYQIQNARLVNFKKAELVTSVKLKAKPKEESE